MSVFHIGRDDRGLGSTSLTRLPQLFQICWKKKKKKKEQNCGLLTFELFPMMSYLSLLEFITLFFLMTPLILWWPNYLFRGNEY